MSNKLLEQILGKASGGALNLFQGTGTVAKNFIAFKPVNGDATFTSLTLGGVTYTSTTIKTTINTTGNFYQSEYYPLGGTNAVIASGEVLFYLGET